MFNDDHRDYAMTLTAMHQQAIEQCRWDQNEAKKVLKGFVASDRRFDKFDRDVLVNQFTDCLSHRAVLDFDDPRLKGLPARPLEKNLW